MWGGTQLYETGRHGDQSQRGSVSDKHPKSRRKHSVNSERNALDEGVFPKDILKAAPFELIFEGFMNYTGSKGVEDQREASSKME